MKKANKIEPLETFLSESQMVSPSEGNFPLIANDYLLPITNG
jgi:hypothetical protein